MRLSARHVDLCYESVVVAEDLSIDIPDGRVSVLIGPNGSGKSTLLRALARLLKPRCGEIVLDGEAIHSLSTKEVARRLAILPQVLVTPESITVEDLVWFGRHPYRRSLVAPNPEDRAAVEWALEATNTAPLRQEPVDQLSGGQRQRAWIALALAQGTDLVLLDEPTTFLDIAYQLEVLDLLSELNRTSGKTIVMVLHDINLAAEYADYVFVMSEGCLLGEGPPEEILTVATMRRVFGIDAHIGVHPTSGRPLFLPIRPHHRGDRGEGLQPATATEPGRSGAISPRPS